MAGVLGRQILCSNKKKMSNLRRVWGKEPRHSENKIAQKRYTSTLVARAKDTPVYSHRPVDPQSIGPGSIQKNIAGLCPSSCGVCLESARPIDASRDSFWKLEYLDLSRETRSSRPLVLLSQKPYRESWRDSSRVLITHEIVFENKNRRGSTVRVTGNFSFEANVYNLMATSSKPTRRL